MAITPDNTSNEEPGADNILLGSHLAHQVTVPAGQTVSNPGCIIKTVLTANPKDYANTSGTAPSTGLHEAETSPR